MFRRSSNAPVLAILGMHRSGTSWFAGSLECAGLELGEINREAPHNARGNRENIEIRRLNEAVLVDSGGSWSDPPADVRWSRTRLRAARDIVARMDRAFGSWGFKDPRTVLALDGWRQVLGDRLRFVAIYRHPVSVADSLARRDESLDMAKGIPLWNRYNDAIVRLHRQSPFDVFRFDGDPDRTLTKLRELCVALQLPAPERSAEFFDSSLVHSEVSDPVPEPCAPLWTYLESVRAN